MPIIKAAIKHLRQSEKRRKTNRLAKEGVKDNLKEMMRLVKAGKMDEFKSRLPKVVSMIDKAVKNNLLHQNNAAHKKSALEKLLVVK